MLENCSGDDVGACQDELHVLKPEVIKCVDTQATSCSQAAAMSEDLRVVKEGSPLIVTVPAARAWVEAVARAIKLEKRALFLNGCEQLKVLTSNIVAITPSFDSYINDETYLPGMASKHLLKWKLRADYSKRTVALKQFVDTTRGLYKQFELEPAADSDVDVGPVLASAAAAFASALKVVTTIAACQVVADSNTSDACELKNDSMLPKALQAEVANVADDKSARKKQRRSLTNQWHP